MKHRYQTQLFAGRAINYRGDKVIAVHVPGRKYRILATRDQFEHLKVFFRTKIVVLDAQEYKERLRRLR